MVLVVSCFRQVDVFLVIETVGQSKPDSARVIIIKVLSLQSIMDVSSNEDHCNSFLSFVDRFVVGKLSPIAKVAGKWADARSKPSKRHRLVAVGPRAHDKAQQHKAASKLGREHMDRSKKGCRVSKEMGWASCLGQRRGQRRCHNGGAAIVPHNFPKYIYIGSAPGNMLNIDCLFFLAILRCYHPADRALVVRREMDLNIKLESADAVRNAIDNSDSRIEELELQLQKCVIAKNDFEINMEEAVQDSGKRRKDIIAEFRVMASSLCKEMGMVETQLKRWKETAHETLCLRDKAQSLKASLSTKFVSCLNGIAIYRREPRNEQEATEAELQTAKIQVEAADAAEDTKNRLHNSP
ncbi:E3 ubiquitin-protein ligase BRE1-like 2 [Pyrus ussuriensis x Pyrus communis]|uniref:E3 ubiquitin protein ligase n=1 Tax=Pyrus ussuriensis x Pyrus communis TaxID=2448454 RepID=A0A5N5HPK5_9ROSA|nr:E3 ubiquitin-protein ligase BRE1-like 2 [Pyrus ussuriensis x Pyrus communis]